MHKQICKMKFSLNTHNQLFQIKSVIIQTEYNGGHTIDDQSLCLVATLLADQPEQIMTSSYLKSHSRAAFRIGFIIWHSLLTTMLLI